MLRHLYRFAVQLHPSGFRRRFGNEMLSIFDQQKGTRAALGVTLDCFFSLLRQWTLRPHIDANLLATPLRNRTVDHVPLFETIDSFQPRLSALINGALLSLILLYMSVVSIRYSWVHVLNLRFPEVAVTPTQPLNQDSKASSEHPQVSVIPTESDDPQGKAVVSSRSPTPAVPVQARGVTIWLDSYVGKYISNAPSVRIWIQIESDPLGGDRLSLSLAAGGRSRLPLVPVSPTRFVIAGAGDGYINFTPDAQGRICWLSLVVNGKVITAERQ